MNIYSIKIFLATLWRMIEGASRHREISWLTTVVVQAGDDGGLDEGSDIGDREREMDTFEIYFGDKMDEFGTRLDGKGVGRDKRSKDGFEPSFWIAQQPT